MAKVTKAQLDWEEAEFEAKRINRNRNRRVKRLTVRPINSRGSG